MSSLRRVSASGTKSVSQDHLMGYQKVQNCRDRKRVKDDKEKRKVVKIIISLKYSYGHF